ncbi:membrane protein [Streptomyces spiroverticillatus]|uniref:Membrane protein n=1 Tax=Streptomyces finlayi TaxID=67296 RepID=A0A918X0U8_9ACTN|nr:DUF3533 domain-containing protein [Streptomyces finlayi]GHA36952.1 membrane protein [Streptomyces spiroverticillatus]GHD01701.1 membrane protein [Streptomyces finlayi]
MKFADELKHAVTPRAALLVIGCLALQLLFITSYVGALHHPKPQDIKVAVVAPGGAAEQFTGQLNKLPGSPLDARPLASEAAARDEMMNRDIDATLLVNPRGGTEDTLLVASGQGGAETRALEEIFTKVGASQQRTVVFKDIAPASKGDANGLSSFYLVVGWCVGGYLCAAILAISAGARPANRKRAVLRLAMMALYAIVSGLLGAVIAGPILGALPGSVWGLWGLGALTVFAVGALTLALQGIFGVVGIGLAILIIVIGGNPSAGGAFPGPLLPGFWRSIGPALPPGAATWVARSIAYFKGNNITGPLLVLSAWALVGTAVTMAVASLRRPSTEEVLQDTAPDDRADGTGGATLDTGGRA